MELTLKEVTAVKKCSVCGKLYNMSDERMWRVSVWSGGHEWAHAELYQQNPDASPKFRRPLYWQFIHAGNRPDVRW